MKKIYLSIALTITFVLGINAQNKINSSLSEDLLADLMHPQVPLNLNYVSVQKNVTPKTLSPTGCDTLGTRWAGGNSHRGNMFDLVNSSTVAIQIVSFDQCFAALQTDSFEVYYKVGTFVGSETTPGAWTFLGRVYMAPTVTLTPIPVPITINISIPAGSTYAFYLSNVVSGSNAYTNGTTLGNVLKQKNGLQFLEGKGGGYPFSVTFSPRIWNGIIHYCTPLIMGVSSLSLNETQTTVYPNPMANEATIQISNVVKVNKAVLKIYDMAGRVVRSVADINENNITLNNLGLGKGLYVLQVENENSLILNQKISIQ